MPTTMINVHVAWIGSGGQCVRQQDERLPRIGLDNATDTKAAFGRWYNALLETNKQVQKEESQNLKEMMNRIWYMRSIMVTVATLGCANSISMHGLFQVENVSLQRQMLEWVHAKARYRKGM